jgi:methylglyoxal reductase
MEGGIVTLGRTDIIIPSLALGTWAMGGGESWGESDTEHSIQTIHRALELGLTFIDTAPAYGNGVSEALLAKALKGRRSEAVIATKCGLVWGPDDEGAVHKSRDGVVVRRNLSKRSIIAQVEESLGRLKTDYIDLLLTHWQSIAPYQTPIEETVEAFERLKREGKIRAWGACNLTLEEAKEYQSCGPLSLIQERFSLLNRTHAPLARWAEEEGITFQAYSPLERGVLTGLSALSKEIVGTAKASVEWYKSEKRAAMTRLLTELEAIAASYHCSVANLVIAWTAGYSKTMNVLFGSRTVEHLEENAKARDVTITAEDWKRIDEAASRALL